jgi:hypothetical protein
VVDGRWDMFCESDDDYKIVSAIVFDSASEFHYLAATDKFFTWRPKTEHESADIYLFEERFY